MGDPFIVLEKTEAWLFVHKIPFTLQGHVKTTRIDKFAFSAKKDDLGTRQTIVQQHPISINEKYKKENCVWKTKYKKLLEMCNVRHVKKKKLFTFQPIKPLLSMIVKLQSLLSRFHYFLRIKNQLICRFMVMVHIAAQIRWVATTKKRNQLHFWEDSSANHKAAHLTRSKRNRKFFHFWPNRVDSPLVDAVIQKFILLPNLYTFSL